ncbi:MAG: hydroxyethylthiazole kinase [Deltaproteobacteria bacterium]|nr:hydroxyethylthiazole kinase [Deltaproteobacteria bacterium]
MARKAAELLKKVREKKPLVHSITNYVTMNYTANALLACGASAVMAYASEEVEEMVSLADALVLNLGTLTLARVEAMSKAGKKADKRGIPIILDPVGVGATSLRTGAAKRLLEELPIRVVRGNPSEILCLARQGTNPKGVESVHPVEEAAKAALNLAREHIATIAVSGKIDLATDGKELCRVYNGHQMMGYMTGAGCTATAVIAAFLAVSSSPFEATAAALSYFGLAGEKAAKMSDGPGTFRIRLIDALFRMEEEELRLGARIEITRAMG